MPWTPDPATPVIDASETAAAAVSITYTPDIGETVTGYTAVWDDGPIPPQAVLAGGATEATLTAPNLIGMFPVTVDYLRLGVPGQVTSWDALPADAEDVIKYVAPGVNVVERHFTVTAAIDGGAPASQQFTVRVTANYSSGRDRLVLEVDARR